MSRFCTLALFILYGLLHGQEHPPANLRGNDEAAVLETDKQYRSAMLSANTVQLAQLFSDQPLIVHSDGTIDSKANFLDAIGSGRLKLKSYDRRQVQVRIYPPVALLISVTTKSFEYKGSPAKATDLSVTTYRKVEGRWRIEAMQNTPRAE